MVTIPVMVSLEGDYTVTIAPVASVDGWQVKMQNPLGAAGSSSQGTFHPALGVLQSVQFAVLAPAYTPPGGTLALTIQRASESSRATRLFPLLGL